MCNQFYSSEWRLSLLWLTPILITTSTAVKPSSWTHLPIFGSDLHHLRTLNRLIWNDITALRLTVANIGQSLANYFTQASSLTTLELQYITFTMYISNHFHTFRLDFICHWLWISNFSSYMPWQSLTQGAKSSPVDARPGWEASQCQSQILQSQCTMFQGKLLRVGLKKNLRPSIWQPSSFHFHTPPVRNPFILQSSGEMDTFWSCLELPCSSEDHVDHSWRRHTVKNPRDSTWRRGVASVFLDTAVCKSTMVWWEARTATAGARVEMLRFDTW